jgi:3-hydroxyisobutyrate dehydrogenase
MQIGFIGLGIMGRPMARNLMRAGFELTVWNRSRPGIEELTREGAAEGASPSDVAAKSEVTITMVTDSPDVEQVVLGEQGIIHGAKPGSVVIDMSTISPEVTRRIAARLKERGIAMLDAPVSGGDKGAIAGTLSIMVGGEEAVFEKCRPVFEAMGKNIIYIGDSGAGQTAKLCNQIAGAVHLQAMAETLMFAARSGIDPARMLQAVTAGAAGSWMLSNLAPRVLNRDFAPGFMVRLQQKDLRLVLEAAEPLHLPLPATVVAHQMLRAVEAEGKGDLGTQAIVQALEKLANYRIGEGDEDR